MVADGPLLIDSVADTELPRYATSSGGPPEMFQIGQSARPGGRPLGVNHTALSVLGRQMRIAETDLEAPEGLVDAV